MQGDYESVQGGLESFLGVICDPETFGGLRASDSLWQPMGAVASIAGDGVHSSSLGTWPLAINDDLYAEVQRRAAADGTTDTAVVEAALRSYLGLGGLIDRIHERSRAVTDQDVLASVDEELDAYRAERDAS